MGFDNIKYKWQPLIRDVDNGTVVVHYEHIYRVSYRETMQPGTGYRRHACLKQGVWCWSNAWEHPGDVVGWLRGRMGKR